MPQNDESIKNSPLNVTSEEVESSQSSEDQENTNPLEAQTIPDQPEEVLQESNEEQVFFIKQFLFFCAGLEGEIVKQEDFKVEHSKYITIGLTVLFTSTLATLSGGYTLYTIFLNKIIAAPFGVLWGLIIFNLDRLVILGVKKDKQSSRNLNSGIGAIGTMAPRILLACTIGFLVSEPVKLRLFKPEIDRKHEEILIEKEEKRVQEEIQEIQGKIQDEIDSKKEVIVKKHSEIDENDDAIEELRRFLNDEVLGRNGGDPGRGDHARALEDQIQNEEVESAKIRDEVSALEEEIDGHLTEIRELQIEAENAGRNIEVDASQVSLLDSMNALHELSAENNTIRITSLFVTALFVLLELLPIFAKMMLGSGVYEELLDRKQQAIQRKLEQFEKGQEVNSAFDEHFADILKTASETRRKIAKLNYKNEIEKSKVSLTSDLEAEKKWQAKFQQDLHKFRHKILQKVLSSTDDDLQNEIERIGGEFSNNLSTDLSTLIGDVCYKYKEALGHNKIEIEELAYGDAREQGIDFLANVRQVRENTFHDTTNKAREKSRDKVDLWSDSIVEDISRDITSMTNELESLFARYLSDSANERSSQSTEEYSQYVTRFDTQIHRIRKETMQGVLDLSKQLLHEKFDGLSEEMTDELLKELNVLLKNKFSQNSHHENNGNRHNNDSSPTFSNNYRDPS